MYACTYVRTTPGPGAGALGVWAVGGERRSPLSTGYLSTVPVLAFFLSFFLSFLLSFPSLRQDAAAAAGVSPKTDLVAARLGRFLPCGHVLDPKTKTT